MSARFSQPSEQKLRGGYYTPPEAGRFLANWAIPGPHTHVLEPSCGDGNILAAAANRLLDLGATAAAVEEQLFASELFPEEASKAADRCGELGVKLSTENLRVGDFFHHCAPELGRDADPQRQLLPDPDGAFGARSFDAVIGNPPFIRYQHYPDSVRRKAFQVMTDAGMKPTKLTNAWVPFVVAGTLLLRTAGRLGMVIPAELLQVSYAADLRLFLTDHFRNLTLVTFRKLVFEGVQQEVVLLLGERGDIDHSVIRTIELNDLGELRNLDLGNGSVRPEKDMDHSKEKWTRYFLDEGEIGLLRDLELDERVSRSGEFIDVDVGIVTGRNKFFLLSDDEVRDAGLKPYEIKPIVGRSVQLSGLVLTKGDFRQVREAGWPVNLFQPGPNGSLSDEAKSYISSGESNAYHTGYKCRIRKEWWVVPSVWTPDGFLLRQIHGYPKLVLNRTTATTTDTIHRVRFHSSATSSEAIATAFHSSLVFAFAEVVGRSYGGGVLELEPTEAEAIPMALLGADRLDLQELDRLIRQNREEEVLNITDKILLQDGLGLRPEDVQRLRGIWTKLRDRRILRT